MTHDYLIFRNEYPLDYIIFLISGFKSIYIYNIGIMFPFLNEYKL